MGTWGVGALENDGAMDFVGELQGTTNLVAVRAVFDELESAKRRGDYLDIDIAERALASAEITAALATGDKSHLDPSSADYISAIAERPRMEDIARAHAAVALLRAEGEVKDLFAESDSFDEWQAEMTALAGRLTSA